MRSLKIFWFHVMYIKQNRLDISVIDLHILQMRKLKSEDSNNIQGFSFTLSLSLLSPSINLGYSQNKLGKLFILVSNPPTM